MREIDLRYLPVFIMVPYTPTWKPIENQICRVCVRLHWENEHSRTPWPLTRIRCACLQQGRETLSSSVDGRATHNDDFIRFLPKILIKQSCVQHVSYDLTHRYY